MHQQNIDNIYQAAIKLSSKERLILISKLAISLQRTESGKKRKLSELQGLGKELWQNINADEYVSKLRGEWHDRPQSN